MIDDDANIDRITAESEARIAKLVAEGVSATPETNAVTGGRFDVKKLKKLSRRLEGDLAAAKALLIELVAQKNVELWQLQKHRDKLLDALDYMARQNRCGCGHPSCNRCAVDRINDEFVARAKEDDQ